MLRMVTLCAVLGCASLAAAEIPRPADSRWAASRDDELRVSLVTFGPGDAVHQYFGHNALWVENERTGDGVLYNFGMFGFGPDMLPKYLTGQLEFWSAATAVQPTFRHYAEDNRSISVRELDLSPARRRKLADHLEWYVEPEHRNYLYHHYFNNCSTKVRDLIDEALDGQLHERYAGTAKLTHRGDTLRYTEHDSIIHMLLMLWMNDSMENPIQRWDEAFLPGELERMVDAMTYRDEAGREVKLAKLGYTVFSARRAPVPETPSTTWPYSFALGAVIGGLALALATWYRRGHKTLPRVLFGLHQMAIGLALGIPGLVATLFLLTGWEVTFYNENLFIANALTVLSFPFGLWSAFGSKKGLRWLGLVWMTLGATTLLLIVLKVLPSFDQDITVPLSLYAPVNLGCALAHWLLARDRVSRGSSLQAATAAG